MRKLIILVIMSVLLTLVGCTSGGGETGMVSSPEETPQDSPSILSSMKLGESKWGEAKWD
jgi:hypothetical protein